LFILDSREISVFIEIKVVPSGISISQGRTFMVTDERCRLNP
jgi:hypothetical protein